MIGGWSIFCGFGIGIGLCASLTSMREFRVDGVTWESPHRLESRVRLARLHELQPSEIYFSKMILANQSKFDIQSVRSHMFSLNRTFDQYLCSFTRLLMKKIKKEENKSFLLSDSL